LSSLQITLVALAAVLVFWTVGAYNRLMRLRNHILRSFVPVDHQLTLRHTLLQRRAEALARALPEHAETLSTLQAACAQAQAALAHARAHPGAAGALNSLRLAEDILHATRGRVPLADAADADPADPAGLGAQLAAAEAALQFARGRFNEAVMEYNKAVQQFPTRLLAGLFGFRTAGAL
jgi:LemA protein